MTKIINLYPLKERKRIALIAQLLRDHGCCAFMVDSDDIESGKADRYFQQIKLLVPGAFEVARMVNFPFTGVTTVRVVLTNA